MGLGDPTVIPVTSMAHSALTGVTAAQHHTLYTDAEAVAALQTEGTWALQFADSSQDGSGEGQVYSLSDGWWKRIGDIIFVHGEARITDLGTLTTGQQLNLMGIPVAAANVAGDNNGFVITFADSLAIVAGGSITGRLSPNESRIACMSWDAVTGPTDMTVGELSVNGEIRVDGWYKAA